MKTYIWYDYETFGTDTRRDKISQFAGIRTDENFNIINKIEYYCKLPEDYIPNYEAVLVTGITPQIANRKGITEEKLANEIFKEFNKPETISIGYNSIKFDDEVTRNLFYRNMRDPYSREWKNGCGRWDFLRGIMAFYMLSPNSINWPKEENEKVSFRLEKLTEENGIIHKNAHDAMSDVIATIEFAKLLHSKNKELYDSVFLLRDKNYVNNMLRKDQVFLHGDFSYGYDREYKSLLYKVNIVKPSANDVIFLDLNSDLEIFKNNSVEEIKEAMYMKTEELKKQGRSRPGVKLIRVNQSPLLFGFSQLSNKDSFDLKEIEKKVDLAREIELKYGHKLSKIFEMNKENNEIDVELDIYGGFASSTDKGQFALIHQDVKGYRPNFENKKYEELYFRWKARNYNGLLTEKEVKNWNSYCYQVLFGEIKREKYLTFREFKDKIVEAKKLYSNDEENIKLIEKVEKYVSKLKKESKKRIKMNDQNKDSVVKTKKTENLTLF